MATFLAFRMKFTAGTLLFYPIQGKIFSGELESLSTLFRLAIPAQLIAEMYAQAQAEYPNECCGLLAGHVEQERTGLVVRRYPLKNAAASRVEFLSDPADMFAADREMRQQGIDLLAVYHSHPTTAPLPSRKDRSDNYSPEIVNLIISLQDGTPKMRGWWLTADSATEAEWEVIEEG
jgi:proteasome lid subunit RPN8/RPN11